MLGTLTRNRVGPFTLATPAHDDLRRQLQSFHPRTEIGKIVKTCFKYLPADLAQELLECIDRTVFLTSQLELTVHRQPDSPYRHGGPLHEYRGVVSRRKVTTAGVTALCVAWANATFDAKYMALGTDNTAESNAQVGLIAEITNTHYTGNVRVTCTHVEAANTVPIVGTHTHATLADTIEEHGIFTSSVVGAVTLWDRHLTGSVALAVGDGLTGTYTLTASAEA